MPFYKFKLSGVIASDLEAYLFRDDDLITPKQVETNLKDANGQDIEVDFSSTGGSVRTATDIFFMFRDYKRDNPNSQMILNIKTMAASAGSLLTSGEFWDIVTVEDISGWMNHNPMLIVDGDYRVMQKSAEYLERLAVLYAGVYAVRSKKTNEEIRKMMDEETYLYGQEIVEAGFADEVLDTTEEKDRTSMIANMQLKFESMAEKLQQIKMKKDDFQKAAAKLDINMKQKNNSTQPASGGENNKQEGDNMLFPEVEKTFPTELANIEKAGIDKGKADMIANNKAIMEFKNKDEYKNLPFVQERCEKALEDGENINDLKMSIQALMLDPKNQAVIESPGDINSGGDKTISGEESINVDEAEGF